MKLLKQIYLEIYKILNGKGIYLALVFTLLATFAALGADKLFENKVNVKQEYKIALENKKKHLEEIATKAGSRGDTKSEIIKLAVNYKLDNMVMHTLNLNEDNFYLKDIVDSVMQIEDTEYLIKLTNYGYDIRDIEDINSAYNILQYNISAYYDYQVEPKKCLEKLRKNKKDLENIIEKEDYAMYVKYQNNSIKEDIKSLEKQNINLLLEAKKQRELYNIKEAEALEKQAESLQKDLEYKKYIENINNIAISKKIKYGLEDPRYVNYEKLIKSKAELSNFVLPDKERYLEENKSLEGFAEELKIAKYKKQTLENTVKICEYRIKKDIYDSADAVRRKDKIMQNVLPFILLVVNVFLVINMFSHEAVKGINRMVCIRPISRWKVMLAKIITLTLVFALFVTVINSACYSVYKAECKELQSVIDLNIVEEKVVETSLFAKITKGQMYIEINSYLLYMVLVALTILFTFDVEVLLIGIVTLLISFAGKLFLVAPNGEALPFKEQMLTQYVKTPFAYIVPAKVDAIYNKVNAIGYNETYGQMLLLVIAVVLVCVAVICYSKKDILNK